MNPTIKGYIYIAQSWEAKDDDMVLITKIVSTGNNRIWETPMSWKWKGMYTN